MPYINQEKRKELEIEIQALLWKLESDKINPGEYNYVISRILHHFILRNGLSYTNCNTVMGIIDCVGKEFYREVVSPYEDLKKGENGNISSLDEEIKSEQKKDVGFNSSSSDIISSNNVVKSWMKLKQDYDSNYHR